MIMEKLFTIEMSKNTAETMTYQKRYHEEKLENKENKEMLQRIARDKYKALSEEK